MERHRVTVSEIVATVYCEQKMVFDRRHGTARPEDVRRKAASGTFEHLRFQWEGYSRNPVRLLAKFGHARRIPPGPAADSRCFIATAVYGAEAHQTYLLRSWRDRVLLPTWQGRLLTRIYYSVSPLLLVLLRTMPGARSCARAALDRFVRRLGPS